MCSTRPWQRTLSYVLRHGSAAAGLGDCLTPAGFVPLRRLLALNQFKGVTAADGKAMCHPL